MEQNELPPFRFGIAQENENEFFVEIDYADYERDLASGIPEDELLKPGKHKFRRIAPERVLKKDSKIRVEFQMKLDSDVLKHFQNQSENGEIETLQLLLNEKLRVVMESELKLKEVENVLLKDKNFIAALAEEIKKVA